MASYCLYLIGVLYVIFWTTPAQGRHGGDTLNNGLAINSHDVHNVVAQKNGNLLLNCSVEIKSTDYGAPIVTWRKDGELLNFDNRIQKVQNGSLYFKRVWHKRKKNVSDEGMYECIIKNRIGSIIARRVRVRVASIAKDYSTEPVSQEVEEGGVARFECKIKAVPPPLYTWIKDEVQLAANNRYIIINSGILQILRVNKDDEGHYSCHATTGGLHHLPDTVNSITWKRSSEVYLNVKSGNKLRPASIVAGPTNTKAQEGQTAILECLVDGNPSPTVKWKREDGVNITRSVLLENNLKLLELEKKDSGNYICEVSSQNGPIISAKAKLTVTTPPVITAAPKSQSWPRARLTRFSCDAEGNPKPDVTWYKNGIKISSISKTDSRYKIKEDGQLVIEQSITEDSGYYQCFAENSVDFTTAFARLEITTKDTAPGKPNVTAYPLSSKSIRVSWTSPEFEDRKCDLIGYVIKLKERGRDIDSTVLSASVATINFDDLRPYTNYTVQVTGFTSQCGAGEMSNPFTVLTWEDVPSKAPTIRLVSTTPNSITVKWDELDPRDRNGVITEYLVFYMMSGSNIVMKDTAPGNATFFLIKDLEPDTEYQVRVLAATSAGYGRIDNKYWPWVDYRTPVGDNPVPRPPSIQVLPINSTTVNVTWEGTSQSVPVEGYQLSLQKIGNQGQPEMFDVPGNNKNILLTNLEKGSFYTVTLVVRNQFGFSNPVVDEFQTNDIPSIATPVGLKVNVTSATEVHVTWSQPSMVSRVMYYTVLVYDQATEKLEKEVTAASPSAVIKGLKPFTFYKFEVQVHTLEGKASPYSSPVITRTKEDVPSPPVNMSALMRNGNIIVTWKPPALPNGQITTYVILYQLWSDEEPRGDWHKVQINGTKQTYILQYYEGRYYYLKMAACTGAGQSNSTITITVPEKQSEKSLQGASSDQKTGIIIGCLIGIVCIIICVLIILCRNRCFKSDYPPSPVTRCNGNGHLPNHRNGHLMPQEQRLLDHHQMEQFTTIPPENQNCDSKGCGSGNFIVTPNGSKVNGYVPFKNGVRNGHIPNGHVTTFIGRGEPGHPEESRGLIAYMMSASEGSSHATDQKSSLDNIDTSLDSEELPQDISQTVDTGKATSRKQPQPCTSKSTDRETCLPQGSIQPQPHTSEITIPTQVNGQNTSVILNGHVQSEVTSKTIGADCSTNPGINCCHANTPSQVQHVVDA